MLGDSLLIMIGLLLITLGIQSMINPDVRKNSVAVINSIALVTAGIFIVFYWNSILPP